MAQSCFFLCAQTIEGNLISGELLQEAQVSAPLATSKTQMNGKGTSISLRPKWLGTNRVSQLPVSICLSSTSHTPSGPSPLQ